MFMCNKLQMHTYHIKANHAASGLTILDVEEEEDVNGSQNEVKESPSTGGTNDVSLLGHHPEGCAKPVNT